jgi:ABC-2 type transport system permease protein
MNIRRTLTITRRIIRGLRHDWRALALMMMTPVVAVVIFGLAFSGDVSDVHVAVVNQDEGYRIPPSTVPVSIADAIIANLDPELFTVDQVATETEAVNRVRSGKAYGVIIFPEGFTRDVYARSVDPTLPIETTMRVELDKTNMNVANRMLKAISDAMLKTSASMRIEAPVHMDASHAIYGQNGSYRDFFVPGIVVFTVFILTFILTLLAFVSERTSGILERLQVTPLRESEVVMGYALAYSIIAVLQTATVLVVIVGVFKVMVVGSIFLAFLVMVLLAVLSLSMGILASSLAKREAQAVQALPLITLPVFLLGGIFWPAEAIPSWLRPLSYAIPPSYAVNALRSVMLRGWGIGDIWVELVALAGFTAAVLVLSVWSLHRARG